MIYNVTKLFLKTKEALIATFADLKDAEAFIATKLAQDEINHLNVLYRIYDENELIREFNKELQASIEPDDAETFSKAQFSYNVQVQSLPSLERIILACFNDKDDASLFITNKCSGEAKSDSGNTFFIFKEQVLLATLNRAIMDHKILKDSEPSGQSTGATLSPLSRRPTPPGGPGDNWVEKTEDNE